MAIDLYKPFTNPITRETFRCISSTPEVYTMEWTVHPGGYVPFEHVRHIAYNHGDEKLVCIVDYRPGLDHYTTMQCFAGLTLDGQVDRRGLVNIPKIMYLLKRANAESLPRPAFAPDFAFHLGMEFFGPLQEDI